jgi:hypothetical protein
MAGSHIATTPYYTITLKGGGPVVGFSVGFSLGTYAVGYDWDLPSTSYSYQIHFIPIESVCHALYAMGGLKGYNSIPYYHSKRRVGLVVGSSWVLTGDML